MASKFNPDVTVYRRPSVTAFNRLLPVPVSIDYEQNLRAEVHDALWFLARQWQMGEFTGEDAGAPAFARVESSLAEPTGLRLGTDANAASEPYNYREIPLEVLVEREAVVGSIHARIQAGFYFQKLLKTRSLVQHLPSFIENYPLPVSDLPGWDIDGFQLLASSRGHIADGLLIVADLGSDHRLENWIRSNTNMKSSVAELLNAANDLSKWLARTYPSIVANPEAGHPKAWKSEQLEYSVSLEMKDSVTGQATRIVSDNYADGQLDWPDFTWSGELVLPGAASAVEFFIPKPVRYQGMPRPRYWEMEEGHVNFGNISISPANVISMAFAEFGLAYSNDWFWIPMPLKINSVCRIDKLQITNVFGDITTYAPKVDAINDPLSKFTLFELLTDNDTAMPVLYLPPTLTKVQEAEPLEQVYFLRDEQSNMAWAVETIVPSASQHGLKMTTVSAPSAGATGSTALIYKLGNVMPENWTPFVPVLLDRATRLQRARMPGSKPAKGLILQDKPPGTPYFIREEEIGSGGVIVERSWQRVRWINGRTFTWIGRRKTPGRFANSSGMAWDEAVLE